MDLLRQSRRAEDPVGQPQDWQTQEGGWSNNSNNSSTIAPATTEKPWQNPPSLRDASLEPRQGSRLGTTSERSRAGSAGAPLFATELPYGWQQLVDAKGQVFFTDHINGRTTFVDPRLAFPVEEPGAARSSSTAFRQRFDGSSTALDVLQGRDLSGVVALVTGASSGIGFETSRSLALHGARVFLACRDAARGAHATQLITSEWPQAQVDVLPLDLSSLRSVRECAASFISQRLPLHVAVCNAAVFAAPWSLTEDLLESTFQVPRAGRRRLPRGSVAPVAGVALRPLAGARLQPLQAVHPAPGTGAARAPLAAARRHPRRAPGQHGAHTPRSPLLGLPPPLPARPPVHQVPAAGGGHGGLLRDGARAARRQRHVLQQLLPLPAVRRRTERGAGAGPLGAQRAPRERADGAAAARRQCLMRRPGLGNRCVDQYLLLLLSTLILYYFTFCKCSGIKKYADWRSGWLGDVNYLARYTGRRGFSPNPDACSVFSVRVSLSLMIITVDRRC
ncbi:WW domain-containing oxidoreductase isoform X1 [Petromyzon marinus]|uniref:WW domain-containing oxidoreductase isoform X1 n=1 Tax=Petromyzon marinus TaxID=7757 RepID=UPI003F729920